MKKLLTFPLLMTAFTCFAQHDPAPLTDGLGRQQGMIHGFSREEHTYIIEKPITLSMSVSPEEFKNEKFLDSLMLCSRWVNELACAYKYTLITITVRCGPFKKKERTFKPAMVYHKKEE